MRNGQSLERLLYISESRIESLQTWPIVAEIIAGAQVRNEELGLTGALLFTGTYFAQILEGPTASITRLMRSLGNDIRHTNIVIVDRSFITGRKFSDWKMAYHGPSQFVSRHVARLLNSPSQSEHQRATEWLTELAHEFSGAPAA